MLTTNEIEKLSDDLRIPPAGKAYLLEVRSSAPSRVVSDRGPLIHMFPSQKMGRTIQFESDKCELPWLKIWESEPTVLEFWDQPPAIHVGYEVKARRRAYSWIPDFLLVTLDGCRLVECKSEAEMIKLSERQPGEYVRTPEGSWGSPRKESAAAGYGFRFQIVTSDTSADLTSNASLFPAAALVPWNRAGVERYQSDIHLVSPNDKITGHRPWFSFLVDEASRLILASVMTIDPPNEQTKALLWRQCARSHHRLPQALVLDIGELIADKRLRALLASCHVSVEYRPPARRKSGTILASCIESVVQALSNKSEHRSNKRHKRTSPKKGASFTSEHLLDVLSHACELYNNRPYPGLGKSPKKAFEQGLKRKRHAKHRLTSRALIRG